MTLCAPAEAPDVRDLIENHVDLVGILVTERVRKVPTHVNRDDLMSAGLMALVLSARDYDPSRGVPFHLFASIRIRGALLDELRAMDWACRSVRVRARDVENVRAALTISLDRTPSNADIACALGISVHELRSLYADHARGNVLSLQGFATEDVPAVSIKTTDCPESLLLHREQIGYLHDAIAVLPDRLRYVVSAYFFDERPMSDIAMELGITQSRVSQMCSEATSLIRDGMNSQLNPAALAPLARTGRTANARNSYYQALAAHNTVGGRLAMSTASGEMRRRAYPDQAGIGRTEDSHQSRIA